MVKFEPYRLDRWLIFLHPDTDPLGKGLQLHQSLISLGSGGIFGKGLGNVNCKNLDFCRRQCLIQFLQ